MGFLLLRTVNHFSRRKGTTAVGRAEKIKPGKRQLPEFLARAVRPNLPLLETRRMYKLPTKLVKSGFPRGDPLRHTAAKLCLILLVLVLVSPVVSRADSGYPEALRAHLTRLRGMLVSIVAAMPEDKYDFRPTKDV